MNSPERTTPDLEELAAYIDGRLEPHRRRAVERRLVRDESFYRDYLATLQFVEEESPPTLRSRFWFHSKAIPAFGIAAALFSCVFAWWVFFASPSSDLFAGLEASSVVASRSWDKPGWTPARDSTGLPPGLDDWQKAFRLGARTADLEFALEAGDLGQAARAARRAARLCEVLELAQSKEFEELALVLADAQGATQDIRRRANFANDSLGLSVSGLGTRGQPIQAGRWLQATRFAALTSNWVALEKLVASPPEEAPLLASKLKGRLQRVVEAAAARDQAALRVALDSLAQDLGG